MNRKLTLTLALLILAIVSLSIATAVNDTHDSVATDDSGKSVSQEHVVEKSSDDKIAVEDTGTVQTSQDTDVVGAGGLTITKDWDDDKNATGKRPSSVSFAVLVDGKEAETGTLSEGDNWQATLNMAISQDSTYEVVEKDVPDGYESSVSGNVTSGFVITNTLNDTPENDTDKNATPSDDEPDDKNPTESEPKNNAPDVSKKKTTVITTTTTKEVPAEDQADNETEDNETVKHDTGNPVLLGVLAVSLAGLAYALYRRE